MLLFQETMWLDANDEAEIETHPSLQKMTWIVAQTER